MPSIADTRDDVTAGPTLQDVLECVAEDRSVFHPAKFASLDDRSRAEVVVTRDEMLQWALDERCADGYGMREHEIVAAVRSAEARALAGHLANLVDLTDHATAFAPSIEDEAWWSGYTLARDGEDAEPPSGASFLAMVDFYSGKRTARTDLARRRDLARAAWIEWYNEMERIEGPIRDCDLYRPGATS